MLLTIDSRGIGGQNRRNQNVASHQILSVHSVEFRLVRELVEQRPHRWDTGLRGVGEQRVLNY